LATFKIPGGRNQWGKENVFCHPIYKNSETAIPFQRPFSAPNKEMLEEAKVPRRSHGARE